MKGRGSFFSKPKPCGSILKLQSQYFIYFYSAGLPCTQYNLT